MIIFNCTIHTTFFLFCQSPARAFATLQVKTVNTREAYQQPKALKNIIQEDAYFRSIGVVYLNGPFKEKHSRRRDWTPLKALWTKPPVCLCTAGANWAPSKVIRHPRTHAHCRDMFICFISIATHISAVSDIHKVSGAPGGSSQPSHRLEDDCTTYCCLSKLPLIRPCYINKLAFFRRRRFLPDA